ncbi:MAG: hypothetical protein Q8L47_03025 [bacterium]|nr:hypothetical protein [bacterium]
MSNDPSVKTAKQFPLYRMIVNKKPEWLTLREAGIVYNSMWVSVKVGGQVLEVDWTEREITKEERNQIREIADRVSESK